MSRFQQEFAPNPGLPLPRISEDTVQQTLHDVKSAAQEERTFTAFMEKEMQVLDSENEALAEWLKAYVAPHGDEEMRFEMITRVLVYYRALRKQAEGEALNTGDFDAPEKSFLPIVLGAEDNIESQWPWDPSDALPFSRAQDEHFVAFMFTLIQEENPAIFNGLKANGPDDPVSQAICGMYWLLKYHSKPRQKKE